MQNSDDIYKETKLDKLEERIHQLEDVVEHLREKNKNLQNQEFADSEDNNNRLDNNEEAIIRDKIETMIEQIDQVLE